MENNLFSIPPLTMMIGSYEYSYSNAAALWSVACARSSTCRPTRDEFTEAAKVHSNDDGLSRHRLAPFNVYYLIESTIFTSVSASLHSMHAMRPNNRKTQDKSSNVQCYIGTTVRSYITFF